MFIITTEGKQKFISTKRKLNGGQRSGITAKIYKIEGKDGLWAIKDTRVFQEYLGYTGFNSLGINIGKFDIGYIDKNELNSAEAMVFVCEYLEGTSENPISVNNKGINDYKLNKIVPLVIASIILGDIDGTGKNNDNFLFESCNGEISRLFKIDCGRSFEGLRESDYSQRLADILTSFLGNLGSFINDNINNTEFISEVKSFLNTINISKVKNDIITAYNKFQQHMKDLKNFKRTQRFGDHNKCPATDGAIVYLTSPSFRTIQKLASTIENVFNLILNEFNVLTAQTNLTEIKISIEPNNSEQLKQKDTIKKIQKPVSTTSKAAFYQSVVPESSINKNKQGEQNKTNFKDYDVIEDLESEEGEKSDDGKDYAMMGLGSKD